MINFTAKSNSELTLKELFRKRDLITQLLEVGYDLRPELEHVMQEINNKIVENKQKRSGI